MSLDKMIAILVTVTFFSTISATEPKSPEPVNSEPVCTKGRHIGTIRLTETYKGYVEVCAEDLNWVGVCADDFWDINDAMVVCRHLGLSSTEAVIGNNTLTESNVMYLSNLNCTGTERGLLDCPRNTTTVDETQCELAATVTCSLENCRDGELRLQDGSTRFEGRIEICFQQQWGTIQAFGWARNDANVACGQLGFSDQGALNPSGAKFAGSGPIFLTGVDCGEDDDMSMRLIDCPCREEPISFNHNQDSGVECIPADCEHNQIRLRSETGVREKNGPVIYGNVEVCLDQQWGSVCDTNWDKLDAQVVCAELGFFSKSFAMSQSHFGPPPIDPILMDNVQCHGNESTLMDCTRSQDIPHCSYNEIAGVICTNEIEGIMEEQRSVETLGLIVAVCVLAALLGISVITILSAIIIHIKARAAGKDRISPTEKCQTTEAQDNPQELVTPDNLANEDHPYDELTTNPTYAELENYSTLQHNTK